MPTLGNKLDRRSLRPLPARAAAADCSGFLAETERRRIDAFGGLEKGRRSAFGQFATPSAIAVRMAAMFEASGRSIRLLDAGAGVGSLTAAFVAELCQRRTKPKRLEVTCVEVERAFAPQLGDVLGKCGELCSEHGIAFDAAVRSEDFIAAGVSMLDSQLFGDANPRFDCAILNPPYRKIHSDSTHRRLLTGAGIQTGNLYTAFMALAVSLLKPGGELVAITPRSFCNGPYFKPFRQFFLREMSIRQIHVFESRSTAFGEDDVLQENIIIHAMRGVQTPDKVVISTSQGPDDESVVREISPDELVRPDDAEQFIHIAAAQDDGRAAEFMAALPCSLAEIGLSVSTGRLVDFRSQDWLVAEPREGTVPLIYPTHFAEGWIRWPKLGHKKPNACRADEGSAAWLIPAAVHVLTKRFSAKEEKRRIVAAIFDPQRVACEQVAFENHVNYFHAKGKGLDMPLAKGLTVFLNSTLVDTYFRQFSGHTQVNASDLRNLKYPTRDQLQALGQKIGDSFPPQDDLDRLLETEFSRWRKKR